MKTYCAQTINRATAVYVRQLSPQTTSSHIVVVIALQIQVEFNARHSHNPSLYIRGGLLAAKSSNRLW